MKNIDQTKNKLNTIFKRYGLILSLLFISLGYSGNAWGGTYYLLMGTNSNPSGMTSKGSQTADDEYEWTVTVQTSGNNYFGISTSDSYTNLLNASGHTITCNLSPCTSGGQHYNSGGIDYYFKYFSSNQSSTVVIRYKASTTTYTISASSISVPVVRMGDIPTPNPATNEAVTAYAYLAKTGCANVTKLRIYIGKDGSPTKSSDYVEYTTGNPYSINNQYAITIPASKLNEIAGASSSFTAHIKATGFNSAGESELSDELTFTYQACPIGVEITPSSGEMLVGSPTTFSTSVSGAGGTQTYKWYVNDVEQSGQTSSTFGFTPTEAGSYAVKVEVTDDCTRSATANMTTCNSPTISSLTLSSETTTPWEPVIITATVANTDNVVFTATGATIIATQNSSTEWEGRFKAGTVKTYEVTATATSSSSTCGSDTETVEIDVEADVEVCP